MLTSNLFVRLCLPHYVFIFKVKPDSPSKPAVTDVKKTEMSVSWTPPDLNGGTPITGYLLEYKKVTSSQLAKVYLDKPTDNHVVQGLVSRTKYQFRIMAQNQVGWSIPSDFSEVYETLGNFFF